MKVRLNEYDVTSPKLDSKKTMVNLSDIHSDNIALANILKLVEEIGPDIITMSGDILDSIDDARNLDIFKQLLILCQKNNVVISLGNHDSVVFTKIGRKRVEVPTHNYSFFEALQDNSSCHVLFGNDYSVQFDSNITMYGINPSVKWYQNGENRDIFIKNLNKLKFKDSTFNILLSHTPNPFFEKNGLERNVKADLILSGHNHGGLTPQIIQNHARKNTGFFGPYSKIKFPNAYGHYNNGDTSLIISNGVTKLADSNEIGSAKTFLNSRFMPDIDVIQLMPGEQQNAELTRKRVVRS